MPLVPTPPDFGDGASSSSQMNGLRDAIKFLRNPPIAELRQTVAQSIPNFPSNAAILFDTEDVDTDIDGVGGHSTSSSTSRYTARYPGWYGVGGGIAWAANATGRRWTWLRINGVDVGGSQIALAATSGADIALTVRTKQIFLAIGDYVELMGMQDSGGALNTYVGSGQAMSSMSVRWVSI